MGKIYTWSSSGSDPADVTLLPMPDTVSGNNICYIADGSYSGLIAAP